MSIPTKPYKRLHVHVIGDNQSQCVDRLSSLNSLLQSGSRDYPDWSEVRWNYKDAIPAVDDNGLGRPYKCLRIEVIGDSAEQIRDRFATLVQMIKAGSEDFPEWADVTWNHGGGGGP